MLTVSEALYSKILSRIKPSLRRAAVDRALVYAFLSRSIAVVAGPVTLLLVASYMTPSIQGFHYTFLSLLALQSFVDLGLSVVIAQFAAHEWAHLKLDSTGRIFGDADAMNRLIGFGRFAMKWYGRGSVVFTIGVLTAGYLLFSQRTQAGIDWFMPWLILVILTALQLCILPFVAILEGCNQVVSVYKLRLLQGVLTNTAMWTVLVLGGGLWVAPAALAVGLLSNLILLFALHRRFFEPFVRHYVPPPKGLLEEIWPFQWRFGINTLVGYFFFALFTPLMFYYYGTVVAGQMGMTLQISNAIQGIAMVWVTTKVPRYGILIAEKRFEDLDKEFLRSSFVSMIVAACGAAAAWILIYSLSILQHPLSYRVLPPVTVGLFLLAAVFGQVSQCLGNYLIAHKQNPMLVMSVVSGLTNGLLVWAMGRQFGPFGAGVANLVVIALMVVPWHLTLWFRFRTKWHSGAC